MLLCVPDVLKGNDLQTVRDGLSVITFVDGKETAHGLAKQVKNNLQASTKDTKQELLRALVFEKVFSHELVRRATRPKTISYLYILQVRAGHGLRLPCGQPVPAGLEK